MLKPNIEDFNTIIQAIKMGKVNHILKKYILIGKIPRKAIWYRII